MFFWFPASLIYYSKSKHNKTENIVFEIDTIKKTFNFEYNVPLFPLSSSGTITKIKKGVYILKNNLNTQKVPIGFNEFEENNNINGVTLSSELKFDEQSLIPLTKNIFFVINDSIELPYTDSLFISDKIKSLYIKEKYNDYFKSEIIYPNAKTKKIFIQMEVKSSYFCNYLFTNDTLIIKNNRKLVWYNAQTNSNILLKRKIKRVVSH